VYRYSIATENIAILCCIDFSPHPYNSPTSALSTEEQNATGNWGEVKAHRDIKLRSLQLEAESERRKPVPPPRARPSSPVLAGVPVQNSTVNFGTVNDAQSNFDVTKYIRLVPPFREAEVDAYFIAHCFKARMAKRYVGLTASM
jgi:hypothetical protein